MIKVTTYEYDEHGRVVREIEVTDPESYADPLSPLRSTFGRAGNVPPDTSVPLWWL